MTEGMPFATPAIAPRPDATTSFAEAFRVGRSLAQPGAATPATTRTPQDGDGPNSAANDVAHLAAQIDATPPARRGAVVAQAQQNNEQLSHVLIGLKGYPPDQRLAIARHLAQTTGLIDPNGVGPGDVTDLGIDAHLAQAMAVEQFLKRESVYASIPLPAPTPWGPADPSVESQPGPRANPTGAGHMTNLQLATSLGL